MSRTYLVETYGCQMNVHDSERIAGLLDEAGHIPVTPGEQADIVVFNTCAVRENADNKLYGNLSFLAPIKKKNPAMQIAVGGCLAQKDQSIILKKAPYVDVVFGTHNVGSLPVLLERARIEEESQIEILDSTSSTSVNAALLMLYGGITIQNTDVATNLSCGGGLTVIGGSAFNSNCLFGDTVDILDSTPSNDISSGALTVTAY